MFDSSISPVSARESFTLRRYLSANNNSARISYTRRERWDIFGHYRSGANYCTVADRDAREHNGSPTDPNIVTKENWSNFIFWDWFTGNPGIWVPRVARGIKEQHIGSNPAVTAYRYLFSYGEHTIVGNTCVITYYESWPIRVPCSKSEATFPVHGNVISYENLASTLNPVDKDSGVQPAPMRGAVSLE